MIYVALSIFLDKLYTSLKKFVCVLLKRDLALRLLSSVLKRAVPSTSQEELQGKIFFQYSKLNFT